MSEKVGILARLALGLIFLIFGLNGFFHFIPLPELPDTAASFMGGLADSGYFFPVLKGTQVVAGMLLLSGYFVPLALVLLAPIIVQIFLFHFFLTPGIGNLVMPLILIALEAYLGFVVYRVAFEQVLCPKSNCCNSGCSSDKGK